MRLSENDLPLVEDFRAVVLQNHPLIDVRAPVEFNGGAFPGAANLPLLSDEERRQVGICYKHSGNAAAVRLGEKLVSGPIKAERISAWKTFAQRHPDAFLYCFRGGQRSQISQMWLAQAGVTIPRLKGGYKAFRNFLIRESERISTASHTITIGGRTGSGKTLLLKKLGNAIDLEALANHRGSSFGAQLCPQPTQIDFENSLAYALIRHEAAGHSRLVIEDESRNVGRVYVPKPVFEHFHTGQFILLETPLEERIAITYDEYVVRALDIYRKAFGETGAQYWFDDLGRKLAKIRKRLGNERYARIKDLMAAAYAKQERNGGTEGHKTWITRLLREYYDPMYDYQLQKIDHAVIFRGSAEEIAAWIREHPMP